MRYILPLVELLLAIAGIILIFIGVNDIYKPASYIVLGILLLVCIVPFKAQQKRQ